jgi:acyl carrier protein
MNSIDKTLMQLIREVLPRTLQKIPLNESQSLRGDLGIDSIGFMSLAFRLEEEFGIDLMACAEEFTQVQSIEDLQNLITKFKQ